MEINRKYMIRKWLNRLLSAYCQNAPFPGLHLSIAFLYKTGRRLQLKHPKLYDDKMQWIKLNYRNKLITQCNDKVLVRDYVTAKGYGHLLNEIIAIYKNVEEIDLDLLPDSFAMKANHGSSGQSTNGLQVFLF
ncbi:MAG: hypothetical protein Q8S24_08100 [Eubacteriales bacterium]|nr:hypothetical protein [Eubacteriales bacterium]